MWISILGRRITANSAKHLALVKLNLQIHKKHWVHFNMLLPLFDEQNMEQERSLRVHGIRVADRLADSQSEQRLVAGVRQRVDCFREHASWSSVDPSQELEEEI